MGRGASSDLTNNRRFRIHGQTGSSDHVKNRGAASDLNNCGRLCVHGQTGASDHVKNRGAASDLNNYERLRFHGQTGSSDHVKDRDASSCLNDCGRLRVHGQTGTSDHVRGLGAQSCLNAAKIFACALLLVSISFNLCAQQQISDAAATKQTAALFKNLDVLRRTGYMIGHQDDLAYGVNWRYKKDSSDIKNVCGDYPAVYGWDLGGIERPNNANDIDGVPFSKMKGFIKDAYQRGGVITFSWHADNPAGGTKGAWDTIAGTVRSILPGGENHAKYKEWLDKVAGFLSSLKGKNGEAIPIIFRPFHELTGTWFWWGKNVCTADEFKILFRFVVYYLRTEKQLHNLIIQYNAGDNFQTIDEFMERYPGDDVVDMMSCDIYQYDDPQTSNWFIQHVQQCLKIVDSAAAAHHKIPAFGETGYEAIPYAKWWTQTLNKAIGNIPISYVLLWRNHGYAQWAKKMHYYAPFPGQISAADFTDFCKQPNTLLEKDVAAEKIYE
ncbi:MAG: beta-mannosidase [Bacteroidetes bacterium]|nr:beta-mannosidase [Bacteroidota bacterium]